MHPAMTLSSPSEPEATCAHEAVTSHALYQQLVADPLYAAAPTKLSAETYLLTGSTLSGPGMLDQPFVFLQAAAHENPADLATNRYVAFYHVGSRLCGHQGIVHGGLLATLMDESLCRCAFGIMSKGIGVTAKLDVSYRAPTHADQHIVLECWVTEKGTRKVVVEGEIRSLDGTVLVHATCLVVEPRWVAQLQHK